MPLLPLLADKCFSKYRKFIRLFFLQEPFDDILCLIRLATMVEREDDESQACSITPQRLLYVMEIGTAVGRGILWNHHRLTIGIPFLRIEFIRRADLTHHTLMNHLNEQCALFPRNRRGTEFESCRSHRNLFYCWIMLSKINYVVFEKLRSLFLRGFTDAKHEIGSQKSLL